MSGSPTLSLASFPPRPISSGSKLTLATSRSRLETTRRSAAITRGKACNSLVLARGSFRAWPRPDRGQQGVAMLQPGELVRVNLAGLQAEGVMFQAAVTDAVGHIVKQTSEQPPKYLVKLLFSFRGVSEVEVPAERIHADK